MDDVIDQCVFHAHVSRIADTIAIYDVHEHEIDGEDDNTALRAPTIVPKTTTKRESDYASIRPLFGWLSPDIIKKTFEHSTQYARIP